MWTTNVSPTAVTGSPVASSASPSCRSRRGPAGRTARGRSRRRRPGSCAGPRCARSSCGHPATALTGPSEARHRRRRSGVGARCTQRGEPASRQARQPAEGVRSGGRRPRRRRRRTRAAPCRPPSRPGPPPGPGTPAATKRAQPAAAGPTRRPRWRRPGRGAHQARAGAGPRPPGAGRTGGGAVGAQPLAAVVEHLVLERLAPQVGAGDDEGHHVRGHAGGGGRRCATGGRRPAAWARAATRASVKAGPTSCTPHGWPSGRARPGPRRRTGRAGWRRS